MRARLRSGLIERTWKRERTGVIESSRTYWLAIPFSILSFRFSNASIFVRTIETSRWSTGGGGEGGRIDSNGSFKGIPVSFLPFVFSYFPMGGSRKHVFKIIAIRMFTIIVYVRICIVIHLFFQKTKTHSRKGSVYFFLKTKRPNICIYIYFSSTRKSYNVVNREGRGEGIIRGRHNPGDKRRESFVNFEILIST